MSERYDELGGDPAVPAKVRPPTGASTSTPLVRRDGRSAVEVTAGPSTEVTVRCAARVWRRWASATGRWDRIDGGGELLVARGLGDVRHRLSLPGRGGPAERQHP